MSDLKITYQQIRGAPPQQQDALLVGDRVHQGDARAGQTFSGQPLIAGIADGVAATFKAEWMSRRLLHEVAAAYWQQHLAFNAKLVRRSQAALSPEVRARRIRDGSATTVVLAELRNGTATVLNTGDSRAYLIDRTTGQLSRLSKDHTTFEVLKDSGDLPADAQDCDYASLATGLLEAVTAAPMADEDFAVHMGYARLQENQVVLLCSDGVTAHLRDAEIAAEVVAALSAGENACARIVERVRERGACDNTTVIVIEPDEKATTGVKATVRLL